MRPNRRLQSPDTDAWTQASELALAVPQVIALRTSRMLAAGHLPSKRDQEEFTLMGAEKVQAWAETCTGVASQAVVEQQQWASWMWSQWISACTSPWALLAPAAGQANAWEDFAEQAQRSIGNLARSSLTPSHSRATANAKRLNRKSR